MLSLVRHLDYTIVLCDDLPRMKDFYRALFNFPVRVDSPTVLALDASPVTLCLRKRTRPYDGRTAGPQSPGVQLAFQVPAGGVDLCHDELRRQDVPILDPPSNQPWGHRTLYFSDPEGNILEVYEDL